MEDRKLKEEESLELISRMIRDSRKSVDYKAGTFSLIWGYVTVFVSLLIYGGWVLTHHQAIFWLWFLIPVVGVVATWLFERNQPALKRTYLDKVINQIWMVLGLVGWGLAVACFLLPGSFSILFLISLLMGMGMTMTGCVASYKVYIGFGVAGILLSFLCLLAKGTEQILIFAGIFIIMMIIPGHLLNRELRKEWMKDSKHIKGFGGESMKTTTRFDLKKE